MIGLPSETESISGAMFKPIRNKSEQLVHEKLKALCDEYDAQVCTKFRVADVLEIEKSGISDEGYRFALNSHFDFLVAGSKNLIPRFAVEFDGPSHDQNKQIERDKRKNYLCERFGLPLLRMNSRYLDRQFRGLDLLTYCVEIWFTQEWIDEAYATGALPPDADVDPALVAISRDGKTKFPYLLSLDHRAELQRLYEAGRILTRSESYRVYIDQDQNYRCVSYLEVQRGRYAIAETGMRSQHFPILVPELIVAIALSDLFRILKKAFSDASLLQSGDTLDRVLEWHTKKESSLADTRIVAKRGN